MKTESDNELETLASMWKQLKQRMESREDDSRQNDSSRQYTQQQMNNINSPYASKNYQIQIQALQDELFAKNNKLIHCQQKIQDLAQENQIFSETVEKIDLENQQLKQKLTIIEEQIESIYQDRSSSKLIRLENDSLRQDVKRLLELLKKTKDYANIGIDETQLYIKGNQKIQYDNRKQKINSNEEISWVPMKAVEILNEIDLEEDKRDELLLQMNHIYVRHYEDKVQRIKQKSNNEITTMKRQLQSRVNFDGIQAQKTIERLKKQSNSQPKQLNTNQIQDCFNLLKEKENQIKILTSQLQQLEDQINNNDQLNILKRQIFIEGAHWMLAKIMDEVVSYEISVNQLNFNMSQKIDQLIEQDDIVQQQIINKVYKWITDTSRELIESFKDKLQFILESTYSKMKEQQ